MKIQINNTDLIARGNDFDAGVDILLKNKIEVPPRGLVTVDTGIKIDIPNGYMGLVLPKSSISKNTGLIVYASPIDAGYKGNIHLILSNIQDKLLVFESSQKIAQLVIFPVIIPEYVLNYKNIRGSGNFGSTGKFK